MHKFLIVFALLLCGELVAQERTHEVLKGETIYGISRQYGITVDALLEANEMLLEGLKEGQVIIIPEVRRVVTERRTPLIDPTKFDLYRVRAGETLFGLSKTWNITIEEIEELNPELEDGLKVDQILRLPKGTLAGLEDSEPRTPKGMRRHLVLPGETVYSMARSVEWTEEEFYTANPRVRENGLQAGTFVFLPLIAGTPAVHPDSALYEIVASDIKELEQTIGDGRTTEKEEKDRPDTTDTEEVPRGTPAGSRYEVIRVTKRDSWRSLEEKYGTTRERIIELNPETASGLIPDGYLIVPVLNKPEDAVEEAADMILAPFAGKMDVLEGKKVRAAVVLSFYLEENDSLAFASMEGGSADVYHRSRLALDFYAGLRLAADTLRSFGLDITFDVYDYRNSEYTLRQIARKLQRDPPDVVIGPLFSKNAEMLARELPDQWIISPLSRTTDTGEKNRLIGAVSSPEQEILELSRWVNSEARDANLILVYRDNEEQRRDVDSFTQHLEAGGQRTVKHIAVGDDLLNTRDILGVLAAGKHDVFVVLDGDPVLLTSFVNSVYSARDSSVTVLATGRLLNVRTLEVNKLNKLDIYISDVEYIDYSDTHTVSFMRKFRKDMRTDPPRFAFHGYDIGTYFLYLFALKNDTSSQHWPDYRGVTKVHRLLPYGGQGPVNSGVYLLHLEDYVWHRYR